ncbi:sensor histidine kinase [[Phormidium] sp. LEGE 05292]|uniref:sensor histidine kinase n=1 Tax=[Phormidium] sp. LEGE 05292 TaxID=767427 RepID=UPI001D146857|nr:HAMP domain-containing sensor histidine kinase [Phormidium sp. LEGE 05292]
MSTNLIGIKLHLSESNKTKKSRGWYRIFFGVRSRILAWYVVLMACSAIVCILAIRQVMLVRLDQRIEKSLNHETKEFQRVVQGTNPSTGQPFGDDVIAIFDKYVSRNVPDENEYFIALLNGQFYKSDPTILPSSLQSDSELLKEWAQLTEQRQGKKETSTGTLIYLAKPLFKGKTRGVMVMVYFTGVEHRQIDEGTVVAIQVTLAVLAVASVLAWIVAGRALAPLRLLTETAHSITESDLTRRIPVKGSDELAELTITFNEMLDRLQAAFASQQDFVNDASHELRTPITIVRGHLELLGDDPQERRETIKLVTGELDRMNRFVDDLLLLAKAEQPDFLNLETVEVGELTEELYAKAKALAHRDWHLERKGKGRIVADYQRITQAIMELARNATQHTQEKDLIVLGSIVRNGKAYFWVRDTGEGIAEAEQARIFERFARVADSLRCSSGAGLGLSIVRAIAIAHGGWIELLSKPGAGSTFTLVIPVEQY